MAWTIHSLNLFILNHTKDKAVPGIGPVNPIVMFVKQNIGLYEIVNKVPFSEIALQPIIKSLDACNLSIHKVYFTNFVKVVPLSGNFPNWSEIYFWRWIIREEIKLVKPKNIVALGSATAKWLGRRTNLILPNPTSTSFTIKETEKLTEFIKHAT